MGQKKKEKITRDCLRAMKIGDTVVVECKDGYDLDSQKNHRLCDAENGKLPVCLQIGRTDVNRNKAWYQLDQCATRIDATAKKRRRNCWAWNATQSDAGRLRAGYASMCAKPGGRSLPRANRLSSAGKPPIYNNSKLRNMKAIYYCILFVLGFIAIIGIFSEPEPALDMVRWTAVFVVSKSVGFAAGYIAYRLMVRWEKEGKIKLPDDDEV